MEINYLADTNIFLEILLSQEKSKLCKEFLSANIGSLYISDFSLHSIGVITFKFNRAKVFDQFVADSLPGLNIVSLPKGQYDSISKNSEKFNLDFDDAIQCTMANYYDLSIATMDSDFKRVVGHIQVLFV